MAACILRSGLYGCFSSRSSLTQRATATVSPAPRVQSFAPVTLPSCSITGGLSYCSSMLRPVPTRSRGALVVVANNKKSLGCTKQGTRRARRRTSGFRTRMASPTGRKVLKLRRKKGRKMLCPASQRSTAGKKQ